MSLREISKVFWLTVAPASIPVTFLAVPEIPLTSWVTER